METFTVISACPVETGWGQGVQTRPTVTYTHFSQGLMNCQLFIRKIYSLFKVQHEDETLSSFQVISSLSRIPFLLVSHPLSRSVPPSLTVSILRHFNNSKWYIKVNEICHTSGHYDACQGFVSCVRWTAAAHQQPVLLPHHVEYWISKVLENTVAPLISSRHNLQRLTPHAFISRIIFHFTYYSDVWGDRLGRLLTCLAARF